jgi:predicted dienelactone hydrolase
MRCSRVGPFLVVALVLAGDFGTTCVARAQTAPVPSKTQVIDGAKVDLWLPPAGAGPHPLVLFSHAVSGCRDQSAYLMAALAKAGMIVAAPDHNDQRCGRTLSPSSLPPDIANPALFKDEHYAGRRDQLRALRDTLVADPVLGHQIDSDQLALLGHSLGGYTVLAMAGARPGLPLPGLRAVVAVGPYLLPYASGGTPEEVKVPVLVEAGADDSASSNLTEFLPRLGGPACAQVFPNAKHFAWVDSPYLPPELAQPEYQTATATAVVTFIEQAFANGTAAKPGPSTPSAQVACK